MSAKNASYEARVRSSLRLVTASETFRKWVAEQSLEAGDLIYFNNSFAYRDRVKTTKGAYYLGLRVGGNRTLLARDILVGTPPHFNADFKLFSSKSGNLMEPVSLAEGWKSQRRGLGELVFLLIGPLDDTVERDAPLRRPPFSTLRFSPSAKVPVTVLPDGVIVVNTIRDPALIWAHLEKAALQAGVITGTLPSNLESQFAQALEELQDEAYSLVRIGTGASRRSGSSILQRVAKAMAEHIVTYRGALESWRRGAGKEPEALNTILRIAYNFASDASELLTLLVSVADLKPLVLWGTIGEQFVLAEAFRELPWSKSKKKPSLSVYEDLVGAARNRAFHNLFPFDRNVEVDLKGTTFRARRLRLFTQYAKRVANVFEYEDQELVNLLMQFTRAREVVVSSEFWARNLQVLGATAALVTATERTLRLLAKP